MTRARDLANQADLTFDSLALESTDTSVNIGPIITLDRNSASPANWNKTGAIVWSGRNDADESVDYFQINSQIEDYADGTENGRLQFWSMRQGTLQETMFMNSWGDLYFQGYNPKLGWIDHKGTTNDLFVGVNDLTAGRAINFPDADGTLLVSDSNGNVGIGISAPGAKLQVAGTQNTPSGTSKGMLLVRADGSTHGLQMGVTGSAPWGSWIQAQDNNISSPYPLTLQPGGGNVGIGTVSPLRNFSVIGSDTSSSGYKDIVEFLEPNITGGTVSVNFGVANSLNNLGKVDFTYAGAGSTSNRVNLGFHSNDNKLMVYANGEVELINGQKLNAGGATIQTIHMNSYTHSSANPINVWAEVNSAYRIAITPKYVDSYILATYHIPINPTGASNILMAIAPWSSTNSGATQNLLSQGASPGIRHNLAVSWFRSNNGYDANDMQNHVVHFRHDHNTTNTLTYGFQFRSEGSNNTYFCHSGSNNSTWGWVAPIFMELREIR